MSSRPLTPPCVPFGTRRFNRISAQTRTGQGCCSIRPVRVFCLRLLSRELLSPTIANSLCESCRICRQPNPGCQAESDSLPSFSVASIVSICTYGFGGATTHPNPAWLSSCSLSRSSSAGPGCRLLRSPSLSGHFCRMSGKSVLSVWPWLSSDSTLRWTPLPLAKSSRYRATSGLSPYRTCAHRAHIV